MPVFVLILVAALCALAYLVRYAGAEPGGAKAPVKTASVALLALGATAAGAPWLLVAALALCALGDWLLADGREAAFMTGVGAFAAGHIAFVLLFLTRTDADPDLIAARWPVVVALAVLGLVMSRMLWRNAGAMRGPVLGYVPVILSMGAAALALPLGLVHLAAALFVLSDLVLASELFLLPAAHVARRATPWVIWITYWSAQLMFLLAFATI